MLLFDACGAPTPIHPCASHPFCPPVDWIGLDWIGLSMYGILSCQQDNLLTGWIPPSLGSLSSLISISLYGNKLSGFIPESFCDLLHGINEDNPGFWCAMNEGNEFWCPYPEACNGISVGTSIQYH